MSGIGLGDLIVLLALGTVALCIIVGSVYATMLAVRRRFKRADGEKGRRDLA